jgi:cobalt-zinc-cadmium efflux system outer membrane protein
VSVKQPLPIAGGRTGQQKSARQEIEYQERMHAATLLGVRTQVKRAFVNVLFAQQTLRTLEEMSGRLQQIVTITKARFDSGDIAESELLRAEANHSRFLLEVTAAQENLDTAHIALAQAIGRPELRIGECLGALEVSPPQIDWAAMESRLAENPSAAALVAKSKKARLDVRTEEARRFPSPVVGVGYRHYQETGQDTFDVGLGIELPIFDRRQGSVAAAEANAREVEALSRHNANQLRSAVLKLRKRQDYLVRELDEFRNAILPKMTECLAVSQSAFDAGGNSMIEVLDAYKALAETRLSFLEKTRDYAGLLISLEELTSQECFKP